LKAAANRVRETGYRQFDAYGPIPIHGMSAALGSRRSRLPWFTLIGGLTGCVLAYFGLAYIHGIDYPLIVGGKQPGAWQGFVPVIFEMTILLAAFATVGGLFYLCKLPRLYYALFRRADFLHASDDGFFLAIDRADAQFDAKETPELLRQLGGTGVAYVEA
jgi:ActD protein